MSEFTPNVAILPKAQRALWPSLNEIPHEFVLYGGTALALRLGRYATTVSAITYFEDGEAKLFPESLKKKLRLAAMGASPVRPPQPAYLSIEASAADPGQ